MANRKAIDGMLTINEVAELLNVHINTVRRWSNQGTLKAYRVGSRGDRRFRQEDIDSFLVGEGKDTKGKKGKSSFDKLGVRVDNRL